MNFKSPLQFLLWRWTVMLRVWKMITNYSPRLILRETRLEIYPIWRKCLGELFTPYGVLHFFWCRRLSSNSQNTLITGRTSYFPVPKRASLVVRRTVLYSVGQSVSLPVVQNAAQTAILLFGIIEVCGGISLNFCVEACTSRKPKPTWTKICRSSLMMPRTLSSLFGAYKKNLKIRRGGCFLRLRI